MDNFSDISSGSSDKFESDELESERENEFGTPGIIRNP